MSFKFYTKVESIQIFQSPIVPLIGGALQQGEQAINHLDIYTKIIKFTPCWLGVLLGVVAHNP